MILNANNEMIHLYELCRYQFHPKPSLRTNPGTRLEGSKNPPPRDNPPLGTEEGVKSPTPVT